jgi:glutamate---cysteine ligase / carboxylate-amine ligase
MEHRFGTSPPFTLGIEEELLLVDGRDRRLAPTAQSVLEAMDLPEELAGREAYAAQIELRSQACRDVEEAIAQLARNRAAARDAGATLMGVGIHPAAELGDVELSEGERYRRVSESMRGLLRRTPEAALHVHVGLPDPETAIRVCNGLRSHLPLLQGLSANSPWWFGTDSGLASARYSIVRAYPQRGMPPTFRDFADYEAKMEAVRAAGELEDYTLIWWDIRPHPRLGTVELREMDSQAPLDDVAALAALVQSLARLEAERDGGEALPAKALEQSTFRASRDGTEAVLFHGGALRPLREVTRETIDLARPHARDLGAEAALEGIERIIREGGGAGRQRAANRQGGVEAMLALLVEQTGKTRA